MISISLIYTPSFLFQDTSNTNRISICQSYFLYIFLITSSFCHFAFIKIISYHYIIRKIQSNEVLLDSSYKNSKYQFFPYHNFYSYTIKDINVKNRWFNKKKEKSLSYKRSLTFKLKLSNNKSNIQKKISPTKTTLICFGDKFNLFND